MKNQIVSIQQVLNEQPFSNSQWLVFGFSFLIVLFDGFDTAIIGYIAPSLMAQWHVGKPELGAVLSAGLFGLTGGALVAGPLADRFGRKLVLGGAVTLFGLACLLSASADSLQQLVYFRFVTGLGLGAAMPNAVTLTSEYCPDRRRAMVTNAMFCSFPLGAALGGILASILIPLLGWRGVLVLGGSVPLLLAALVFALMPESLRYLSASGAPQETLRRLLARVAPTVDANTVQVASHDRAAASGAIGLIFSRRYLAGTFALWVVYFMGLVIFYSLINWMPTLLGETGLAPRDAALIAALFPLGGVGSIYFGWLMDRGNGNWVLAVSYLLTGVFVFAIGELGGAVAALVLAVFLAGVLLNASQTSLPSLAAAFYPTSARATGVAWMLGAGRFGGIFGTLLVGELVRRQFKLGDIFSMLAVAGVLASIALMIKQATERASRGANGPLGTQDCRGKEGTENA